MQLIQLKITNISPNGLGVAHAQGKVVFVHGAMPGETILATITNDSKSYSEGYVSNITQPSPHRLSPLIGADLAMANWLGIDYNYQLELKSLMLVQILSRYGIDAKNTSINPANQQLAYRNNISYQIISSNKSLSIGQYLPGTNTSPVMLEEGSRLYSDQDNLELIKLLAKIFTLLPGMQWKNVSLRQSTAGSIVVLFTDSDSKDLATILARIGLSYFAGIIIINHTNMKTVISIGQTWPGLEVSGKIITYPATGFFQQNISMFENSLSDIGDQLKPGDNILELYAGSGAIGLTLATKVKSWLATEPDKHALKAARQNIINHKISNYSIKSETAQDTTLAELNSADVLVFDPPRSGLQRSLITKLQQSSAKKLVYLSCDPITAARDIANLSDNYKLTSFKAYDFYPQTPHLEVLAILEH